MTHPLFRHKKVLLFDWNRTLVDTSQAFDNAFLYVLKQYTARYDAGMQKRSWSERSVLQSYKSEWKKLKKRGKTKGKLRYEAKIAALRKALTSLPMPHDRQFLKKFQQQIREREQKNPVILPGVHDVIQKLNESHQIAVLSNSEKINLTYTGLGQWIKPEHCFLAKQAGSRKPNARIFRYAMDQLHVSPSECVMIGNSWRTDIRGAQRAQIDAVWLNKFAKKKQSVRVYGRIHVVVVRHISSLVPLFTND